MKKTGDTRFIEFSLNFLIVLMLDVLLSLRFGYEFIPTYFLLTFASVAIIPAIILFFKSSKTRYILYLIYIIIIFAIFITDSCLYYYKNDVFSLGMILDIGDGITMGIKYNIFIAFNLFEWIIIFGSIILVFWYLSKKLLGKNKMRSKMRFQYLIILAISMLTLLFAPYIVKETDYDLYNTPQDKRTHIVKFGMATFNQKDFADTISNIVSLPYKKVKARQELEKVNKDKKNLSSNVSGKFSGKNLIMVMMETGEEYAVDEELTPTLYKLLHDGYYFSNTYGVAVRNNTYDAEFKSLTSMMYYDTGNVYNIYGNNTFTNALPYLLREEGYTANSFHSNTSTYFNRDEMHMALGFEHFYSGDEMEFTEDTMFPRDSEMFLQMKDMIAPIQEQPFFSFITTYYTHGPYTLHRDELEEFYEKIAENGKYDDYDETFINDLAAHMDLDLALEIMVNDLEEKDLLDDTLIVLFSDHKNYSSMETTKKYSGVEVSEEHYNYDLDKVPFAIYNPSIEKREISYMTSQYDILPTITDLLGVKIIKAYYYGQSVFLYDTGQYEDKPIIFGYTSWIDKNMRIYDNDIIYINPEIEDQEAYYLEVRAQIFGTINTFHSYLLTDYFNPTEAANN